MNEFIATFIFFFAVIDPIGSIPVFIAATTNFNEIEKRRIAFKAVLVSALILLFFIVVGELILDVINIPLSAFQIAGGIVLFLFALSMIFGDSKPESEIKTIKSTIETAIFPIAMPSIASPGAMLAVVLLTKNSEFSIWEQFQSSLILIMVLIIVLILLLLAGKVHKIIGDAGASIISRVMGLILTAVAVANIIDGIKESFNLV
ncbi:MarC family protein [Tenacibaculum piscium]|uniref:MarC family protein n=1 Tax=Tenacibaculum piscium TaxID=1458515 RepID=UPI001F283D0F|nr:MarC family protein [Tenacibaculum piscium]